MKAARVVVMATQCPDTAFRFEPGDKRGQGVTAGQMQMRPQPQGHGHHRNRGVPAHGLVDIVIVQRMPHRAVHQHGGRQSELLTASDDKRRALQTGVRAFFHQDANEFFISAGNRHSQPVQQALLGDGQRGRRQVFEAQFRRALRQDFGDIDRIHGH